jgi:hypothetical protein
VVFSASSDDRQMFMFHLYILQAIGSVSVDGQNRVEWRYKEVFFLNKPGLLCIPIKRLR